MALTYTEAFPRKGQWARGLYSGQRKFLVTGTRDPMTARLCPSLPVIGAVWPGFYRMRLRNYEGETQDGNHVFLTANYDNRLDSETTLHMAGDVEFSVDVSTRNEKAMVDLSGNPIGADAEGTDVMVPKAVIALSKWVADEPSISSCLDTVAHVNSVSWRGGDAGQWLCIEAGFQKDTLDVWRQDYRFEYDGSDSGWQHSWWYYTVEDVDHGGAIGTRKVLTFVGDAQTSVIYRTADFRGIF